MYATRSPGANSGDEDSRTMPDASRPVCIGGGRKVRQATMIPGENGSDTLYSPERWYVSIKLMLE